MFPTPPPPPPAAASPSVAPSFLTFSITPTLLPLSHYLINKPNRSSAATVWPSSTFPLGVADSSKMSKEELSPIIRKVPHSNNRRGIQVTIERHRKEDGSAPSVDDMNTSVEEEEDGNTTSRENGLSSFGAGLNFVKGMLGPGVLSIPLIFRHAGLLMGACLIIFFGLITTKCMHKLVDCSQHLSKRKRHQFLDYGDVAYEACAQGFVWTRRYRDLSRIVVNASIVSLQLGICSVSVVFLAAHLREISVELFRLEGISQYHWILMVTVPLVMINLIRSLNNIVFLSIIGSILMVSSLAIIFQYLIRIEHKPLDQLKLFTDIQGMFTASGAILYAFEGQAMVLPLENKLRQPHVMNAILSWAMFFVSIVYIVCGVEGYATYGNAVEGSIALNLPRETLFTMVRLMLSLVVFFGFVLQQYVIVEMLWPKLRDRLLGAEQTHKGHWLRQNAFLWEKLFSAALVLLSALIALTVPHLEQLIPLVGTTAGMLLAVVFPALLDTLTFAPEEIGNGQTSKLAIRLGFNSLVALIGFSALIGGVEENLKTLLRWSANT